METETPETDAEKWYVIAGWHAGMELQERVVAVRREFAKRLEKELRRERARAERWKGLAVDAAATMRALGAGARMREVIELAEVDELKTACSAGAPQRPGKGE